MIHGIIKSALSKFLWGIYNILCSLLTFRIFGFIGHDSAENHIFTIGPCLSSRTYLNIRSPWYIFFEFLSIWRRRSKYEDGRPNVLTISARAFWINMCMLFWLFWMLVGQIWTGRFQIREKKNWLQSVYRSSAFDLNEKIWNPLHHQAASNKGFRLYFHLVSSNWSTVWLFSFQESFL